MTRRFLHAGACTKRLPPSTSGARNVQKPGLRPRDGRPAHGRKRRWADYGLDGHWVATGWHIDAMRRGEPGKNGRFFAAGAMTYVAAIEAAIDGELSIGWAPPDYHRLAETWQSCAFAQTVKCAPSANRSNPYRPMYLNCSPFLLRDELDLLAPRVVVLLGRESGPRDAVRPLLDVRWGTHTQEPLNETRSSFQTARSRRSSRVITRPRRTAPTGVPHASSSSNPPLNEPLEHPPTCARRPSSDTGRRLRRVLVREELTKCTWRDADSPFADATAFF